MSTGRGIYFDGETARGREVLLDFGVPEHVQVTGEEISRHLRLDEIGVSDRLGDVPRFLYLPDGAVVETSDNGVIDVALGEARRSRSSLVIHALESRQWIAVIGCFVLVTAILTLAFYGPPMLARAVAKRVPPDIDRKIGAGALATIRPYFRPSHLSAAERQRVEKQLQRLQAGDPSVPHPRIEFLAMDGGLPNAFALPGNVIVFTDELLELPATDDEIAAVLAHELGHLEHRHGLQSVLRNSFVVVLVAAMTGDFSTLTSFAGTIPITLLTAGYSRDLEREADLYGLHLLQARGIAPRAFVTILVKLEDSRPSTQRNATYLSTHPGTDERLALFGGITPAERGAVLAEKWLDRAAGAAAGHHYDAAVEDYAKALALSPSAATYLQSAQCRQLLGNNAAAEADAAKAIALDPKLVAAHVLRLELLAGSLKQYDAAIAEAKTTLALDPKNAPVFAMRGSAEMAKGDRTAGTADFDRAIALAPDDPHGWAYRAMYKARSQDLAGAAADYDTAVKVAPKMAWVRYQRGLLRLQARDYRGALVDFDAVPEWARREAVYYYERGRTNQALGKWRDALADFGQGLELKPSDALRVRLCVRQAAVQNMSGDYAAAISNCETALTYDAKYGPAYYERARARIRTHQVPSGQQDLDRAERAGVDRNMILAERGMAAWETGALDECIRDFTGALEKRRWADAYEYRGLAELCLGQAAQAEKDLQDALARHQTGLGRKYLAFYVLLSRRSAHRDDQREEFAREVAAWPAGWPKTVGSYLAGELSEGDFIREAETGGEPTAEQRRCEADFYIGITRLIAGDRAGAEDWFERSLKTGVENYYEFKLARAELQRLRLDD